jgi:hypothetical protein
MSEQFEEFVIFEGLNAHGDKTVLVARPRPNGRIVLETGTEDENGNHSLLLPDAAALYKVSEAINNLADNILTGNAWDKPSQDDERFLRAKPKHLGTMTASFTDIKRKEASPIDWED